MDIYAGKRAVDRNVVSRKGAPHLFRNAVNTKDQSGQLCSRPNCSSRIHSSIVAENVSCRKGKSLRPSTQSSLSGKEAIGRSCRSFSGTSNPRKSLNVPRQTLSSRLETDSSETSSIKDEAESPPSATYQSRLQAEQGHAESDNVMLMEVASTSGVSKTRSQRNLRQPGLHGQETKSIGSVTRAGTSRYNLRNTKCNSVNDVSSTSCSSSDSIMSGGKDMVKRRNYERENSSTARGKKSSGSLLERQNSGSGSGISIYDPRRSRNTPPHRDNIASVRTRRSMGGNARERLPSHGNAHSMQPNESPALRPSVSRELVFPHHTSAEAPLIQSSSHGRPGSRSGQPASPAEFDITYPLTNRSRQQHQNSVAEVLFALERIEQDEELTEEEIRFLETNFLLNGLYSYDQHRDMRMDIDNMSYEELLALEERMGTVSTALTEEALSECLKRSIYQPTPSDDDDESSSIINDDIKCSICQDEYVAGDEVGSLHCEHGYHVGCIQQWLRHKNWCPICKASAVPSDSSVASDQA
ncbi:E3 ubiquitin-protein ligase MBR2 [Neltuma alba]|uniref:E3 ubiquitin-protein ligase MBR2 n=1 Tax=Neltuma alba TaxID=207710 RepID=UPI0010A57D1C|nr:E3 ubiquitin-protein ligase MBR2-like [Prosopis alba]XP_028802382.1 E3 ubiquitin-protein ligase MBR2-like [Prosopis alba]XP_028802383.1 E3 ubiquitin-protein ligase MBR2-like [Prosopis alba]